MVPEPVEFEVVNNASQAPAATSSSTHLESSEHSAPISTPHAAFINNASQAPAATSSSAHLESFEHSAPISMPHAAFVPEALQEATSAPASQVQHSTFWQNNVNGARTFDLRYQDTQNGFSLGSTKDVNMEFLGEATIEPSVYAIPTMWTSSQSQPEQIFYSQVDQVADNINQYQTHIMYNIHADGASMVSIPSFDVKLVNCTEAISSQCETNTRKNSAR
jgi:hypothetical protein